MIKFNTPSLHSANALSNYTSDPLSSFSNHYLENDTHSVHDARHTVGTETIQTPLNFSLFVSLQPFDKIKSSFYFSLMYTQHPILTEKNRNVEIFANLLKKKN